MIIRVLYCSKRASKDNVVTFDTSNKIYADNSVPGFWDVGCDLFVEAKMSGDVNEIKRRLIDMGYTKKGD